MEKYNFDQMLLLTISVFVCGISVAVVPILTDLWKMIKSCYTVRDPFFKKETLDKCDTFGQFTHIFGPIIKENEKV